MDVILSRRSIRRYKDQSISNDVVEILLKAGMAAPSAGNEQPWEFVVLRDREIMRRITEVHPYARMLLNTDVAIVVCGDETKEVYKGFWVQDCSAATENILLAAVDQGLGAVWLGVHPMKDRVDAVKALLKLPENIIPLSIIPIGYPDEKKEKSDRFNKDRIHYDQW